MALNGIFYGTTANSKITPSIAWTAVQSVTGNYSDITATLTYTKKGSTQTTGGRWTGTLTIGGNTKTVTSQYMEVSDGKPAEMMTHTVRVYHDSYGKASVTISATGGIVNPSTATLQNTKISQTVTLDTIPRASGISCTTAKVGAKPTITVTRADSGFTHTIAYQFGTLTGTIAEKTKETNLNNWTIPEEFYYAIPNSKMGAGTLSCVTYNGDTQIGSATCKLVVTTDEELCKPTITAAVEDCNPATIALTGDKNTLVRYESTALCQFTAEAKHGASIKKMTVNGVEDWETIPAVETGTFLFRVEDSRGYVTELPVEKTLIPYVIPTCRAVATRIDPEGNTKLTVQGSCFEGSFGAEENAFSVKCCLAGTEESVPLEPVITGATYTAEVTLTGLDYTRDTALEVVAEDLLRSAETTVTAGKGIPVFHWGEKDFRFHVPVYLENGDKLQNFQARFIVGDINNIINSGTYRVEEGTPGFPFENGGILLVFGCPGMCTAQIAFNYGGSDVRLRTNWYGTWHSWKTVALS